MAIKKLMKISQQGNSVSENKILKLNKLYRLSKILNVDLSSEQAKIPEFFEDIDENGVLSGLPEISMQTIAEISNDLSKLQEEFIFEATKFFTIMSNIEEKIKDRINQLSLNNKENCPNDSDDVFKCIGFNFTDQEGDGDIILKIALDFLKKKEVISNYGIKPDHSNFHVVEEESIQVDGGNANF